MGSLSLSPLSLRGFEDEVQDHMEPHQLRPYNPQWDKYRNERPFRSDSKDTIMLNDDIIEVGYRYHTVPFASSSDESDFEVKHASGINLSQATYDNNIWFYDEDSNKEQKRVVKERNFFSIRNKLNNMHKASQSKSFKLMGQKGQKSPPQRLEDAKPQESPNLEPFSPKPKPSITSREHTVIKLSNQSVL